MESNAVKPTESANGTFGGVHRRGRRVGPVLRKAGEGEHILLNQKIRGGEVWRRISVKREKKEKNTK